MINYFTQDKYFRYFWKIAGVPSSFGVQKSFLDYFEESSDKQIKEIFQYQKNFFSKEQEFGLLNRLDNDTSGFLCFAKTPLFYDQYKFLQDQNKLEKTYIADVYGRRIPEKIIKQEGICFDNFNGSKIIISRGIAHHRYVTEKMVVTRSPKDLNKVGGKIHQVKTGVELLCDDCYDEEKNISTLKITINKGIRHQIRAHLASLGYPIIGDILYKNKKQNSKNNNNNSKNNETTRKLHLWSIGLKTI